MNMYLKRSIDPHVSHRDQTFRDRILKNMGIGIFPTRLVQTKYLWNATHDKPFHNFWVSRSGDQGIWCSSGASCDGFCSSKFVKGFVRCLTPNSIACVPSAHTQPFRSHDVTPYTKALEIASKYESYQYVNMKQLLGKSLFTKWILGKC